MQEFMLVPKGYAEGEADFEPFGDKEDEQVVILATSAEEALAKAAERYDLGDCEWEAVAVAMADLADTFESQTPAAFGIKTFVESEDGRRAVAVFFSESEEDGGAQLVGFLDEYGAQHDQPVAIPLDDEMTVVDVTTRRWPYPGDDRYVHMVVGYDFAKTIAAAAPVSLGESRMVVCRKAGEPIAVSFLDVSDAEGADVIGYVQADGSIADAPHGFPDFAQAHDAMERVTASPGVPVGFLLTGLAFAQGALEGAEA